MNIRKRRINTLSCINWVGRGEKVIITLNDAVKFREKLMKIGFSPELQEGEKILPAAINPATLRNAEKFYVVDRTKPKEQYYQTLWWTRKEWAGRGKTREVSDFVYIPRKRYPRIEYAPYSVELFLKYDPNGILSVVTEPIEFCEQNEKKLINTINIFLTNFGECDVLEDGYRQFIPTKVIRLNWEVLPKGKYPWEKIKNDLTKICEHKNKTAKRMLFDKGEYIESFKPDFRAYGKSGFRGYIIFGFKDKNIFVLESVYPDNATYVFGHNWEYLSQLTKAEILNGKLQDARLIHNRDWKDDIKKLLEV